MRGAATKALVLVLLALLTSGFNACAPPAPPPPGVEHVLDIEQPIVDLTNAHRAAYGLPSLTIEYRLSNAAQAHADDLANTQRLSHDGSNGSSPGDRIKAEGYYGYTWAENVAVGYDTPDAVMAGWIASPGHDANLLSPLVFDIGVAASRGTDGRIYWVMDLAAR